MRVHGERFWLLETDRWIHLVDLDPNMIADDGRPVSAVYEQSWGKSERGDAELELEIARHADRIIHRPIAAGDIPAELIADVLGGAA